MRDQTEKVVFRFLLHLHLHNNKYIQYIYMYLGVQMQIVQQMGVKR